MSVSKSAETRVLIVESKPSLASLYRSHLEAGGYQCQLATDLKSAKSVQQKFQAAAVILSLENAENNYKSHLASWTEDFPEIPAIVIAANASINDAVEAVRAGAWDYLVTPVSRNRLVTTLANALQTHTPQTPASTCKTSGLPIPTQTEAKMLGLSAAMQETRKQIEAIAASHAPAFITGESGTGKELCAQEIHNQSSRADKPFIALNCGAIPHDLMESEIFGHLKGAFTGAISDREGAAAVADGGTLFLDEICEMDLSLQTKLLRFLQTGTIQPVGSPYTRKVDIRIICATNKSPKQEVTEGRFREDLYFRLHVLPVHLAPLRNRDQDVLELANEFLANYAREENRDFTSFNPCAIDLLSRYAWPGNIRELQNIIRQAVVLNDGNEMTADMLPEHLAETTPTTAHNAEHGKDTRLLWQIERDVIEGAISRFAGSVPKAADALGISPSTIYRKRESWAAVTA